MNARNERAGHDRGGNDAVLERLAALRAGPGGEPEPVLAAGRQTRRRRAALGSGMGALALAALVTAGAALQPWDDGPTTVVAADDPSRPDAARDEPVQKGPPPAGPSPALDAWDDFPVEADPRPVVLQSIGGGVGLASFPTDGLAAAFYGGRWDVRAKFPETPAEVDGFPVIGAEEALKQLRRSATSDDHEGTARVTLTRIYLDTAEYFTDRGERELPAWRFSFAEANYDDAAVLAIAEPAVFSIRKPVGRPDGPRPELAELAADGRTLTVHFTGAEAGTGPCQAEYDATIQATPRAVLIDLREQPRAPDFGPPVACGSLGYGRSLTLNLGNELGTRAVIDGAGGAVRVKSAR